AFRVDLRAAAPGGPRAADSLALTLEPLPYFRRQSGARDVWGGEFYGMPRARALAVGRGWSPHVLYLSAGSQLLCVDDRFPRGAVARWDNTEECNLLRWIPGLPGREREGQDVVLAYGTCSSQVYLHTWAEHNPGWRGWQMRLGQATMSVAESAGQRPLTFALPTPTVGQREMRSGSTLLAFPDHAQ
ncbi:unnamed protein product, partial [Discosporangium mesarthrocarpum]